MTDDSQIEPIYSTEEKSLQPSVGSAMRLLLATFALLLIVGSVVQMLHFEIGMLVTQWILILIPALWYWRRYRLNGAVFARVRTLEKKFIPTILFLVVCAWIVNMYITTSLASILINYGYEPIVAIPYPTTIVHLLRYYFVIAISAGICEEVFFRGTIMPSFEKHGAVPALVLSALLFALFHVSFINFFSIFILGLIIGLVVIKTGSLWGGILYHFFNNAIAVTYMYAASNYELEAFLEPVSNVVFFLVMLLFLVGLIYGLKKLQRQSGALPLLPNRANWLPKGWFNWASGLTITIFFVIAAVELLLGFGFFEM
ncbi:MAG: CPBP family intramembrane metalloprotease [Bacillota bacterium]|nr:CPBP family intramembrane metalloprotease [Bacillota bacterium]